MTTVVIAQPNYIPWLGYFERMAQADIFVYFDDVQFERQSWQSRNRLRNTTPDPFWMVVPVERAPLQTRIKDVRIAYGRKNWQASHVNSIRASLGAAPHFSDTFAAIEYWLTTQSVYLADFTIAGTQVLAQLLGITPRIVRSSELPGPGTKTDRLLDICTRLGANRYYSAQGSRSYMDVDLFERNGIKVDFQKWDHPEYPQRGPGFISHLSALDAIMNLGPMPTRNLLLSQT